MEVQRDSAITFCADCVSPTDPTFQLTHLANSIYKLLVDNRVSQGMIKGDILEQLKGDRVLKLAGKGQDQLPCQRCGQAHSNAQRFLAG